MAEHEFERFLEVLSKLLKLSSKETAAVADEICDHLEERYSELVGLGVARDDAVKQALDEFDDAGEFAAKLNKLVRQRTRRRIMTGAFTTAAASALAILLTTAFWPDQRQPIAVVAQAPASREDSPPASEVMYIDEGRFLPEWMRKEVTEDLKPQTLLELKKFLEEVTGHVVSLDHTELTNAGISPETEIRATPAGAPLYLVLNRALVDVGGMDLGWVIDPDDGILKISTSEKLDTIKLPLTIDVSPVLALGLEMDRVIELLYSHTSGPWLDIDGDGGTITPLGQRVTIVATHRTSLESQSVLTALATKAPIVSLSEPYSTKAIDEALKKRVTCRYENLGLEKAMADLGRQTGLRFDFDETELTNSGARMDAEVSLSVSGVTLKSALEFLLADVGGVELMAVPINGLLSITSRERADSIQSVRIIDVSDLVTEDDVPQLISLIRHATSGPWEEIDGDGGTISNLPGPRIMVRQTKKGLDELNKLLNDHRAAAKRAIPVPAIDPNRVETRYYRMTEAQANDVIWIIPKHVAVDSWRQLPDLSEPVVDKVSVPPASEPGVGGGGFFQLGGMGGVVEAQPKQPAGPMAVLVIRQTRRVHRQIEKFLRELSSKSGTSFFNPVSGASRLGGGGLGGGFGAGR